MEHKKLDISLLILTLFSSLASWYSVERAINVENSSIWLIPIVCFSLYFIFLCLSIVLVKKSYLLEIVITATFLLSFFFSWDLSRLIAFLLALLGMTASLYRIKKDLLLNIKVDLGKSIGAAKSILILSIAIMISSQYYGEVKDKEMQKTILKLDISSTSKIITPDLISFLNPQFKNINSSGLTVDEFILQMQKDRLEKSLKEGSENQKLDKIIESQGADSLAPEQKDFIRKEFLQNLDQSNGEIAILEEGRKKLSEMSGKEITGSEKISDVFSDIVNKKINEYLVPSIDQGSMPILPIVIAIILFFTIASLGNLLSIFLVLIVKLVFKAFLSYNWIVIKKVQTEVESIE